MTEYRITCGNGEVCFDADLTTFAKAEEAKIFANDHCEESPHRIEVRDATTYGHWTRAEY